MRWCKTPGDCFIRWNGTTNMRSSWYSRTYFINPKQAMGGRWTPPPFFQWACLDKLGYKQDLQPYSFTLESFSLIFATWCWRQLTVQTKNSSLFQIIRVFIFKLWLFDLSKIIVQISNVYLRAAKVYPRVAKVYPRVAKVYPIGCKGISSGCKGIS